MEIRKYFALFRHWAWLIILCAAVAGTLAFFYSSSQPKLYRASGKFQLVVATGGGNSLYVGQIVGKNSVQDYLQLIPTREVAEAASVELQKLYPSMSNQWTVERILGSISVSSPLDSQIIVISAVDTNATRAADIVNTVGQVFAERQEEIQGQNYLGVVGILDEQIADFEDELTAISAELEGMGEISTVTEQLDYDRLTRRQELIQNGINAAATQKVDEQRVHASTINRFIAAEKAVGSDRAFSPNTPTNTILAVIVGAMLAIGVVALIDYLDDTVKSADEILASTGLSTLASISFIKGDSPADRLITHVQPRSPISEAFRVLRTNLSFAAIDTGLKSVLITSSTPSEGKSTSSANIATAMAQTGYTVALVDADLRRPTQHKVFQLSNNHGLTTALLDAETPASDHLQTTTIPGLKLLASGPLPPNPAELLNSQRMSEVIDSLQNTVDVVIIDTPPVLTVADAAILAPKVSGCVVVAQLGKTRQDMLNEAADRLRASGASVFGIVLNRTSSGRNKYYEYYNEQYYTGDYASKPAQATPSGLFARLRSSTTGD